MYCIARAIIYLKFCFKIKIIHDKSYTFAEKVRLQNQNIFNNHTELIFKTLQTCIQLKLK